MTLQFWLLFVGAFLVGIYLIGIFIMARLESRISRFDPIGCLAWPWWFARYSKRMWIKRSREYDERRNQIVNG
jgi:hypothetical protein